MALCTRGNVGSNVAGNVGSNVGSNLGSNVLVMWLEILPVAADGGPLLFGQQQAQRILIHVNY